VPARPLNAADALVGAAVRRARRVRGLSQAALAVEVGVTQYAISRVENGRRSLTLPEAWRLARALGVTLDDLAPLGRARR